MFRDILLFVLFVFLMGCAETKNSPSSTLNEYQIPYGETIRVDSHEITFLSVVEDNRCPDNVQCIWEGRAVIQLEVDGALKTIYFGETRQGESKSLSVFSDYNVHFLNPRPEADKKIDKKTYLITLKKSSK